MLIPGGFASVPCTLAGRSEGLAGGWASLSRELLRFPHYGPHSLAQNKASLEYVNKNEISFKIPIDSWHLYRKRS
jgi:hypothetical protein